MKAEVMVISPETANELLKRNKKNRNISERQVKRLSREMINGNWSLNGEPIKFNDRGDLIDGQHRLSAVVSSGVSVLMLVVQGISDPNAFATIDQNRLSRGAYTILQMNGVAYASAMASISKKLLHWDNTKEKENFTFNSRDFQEISSLEIADYYEKNKDDLTLIYETIKDARILKRVGAGSALVAAMIICFRNDPEIASTFINQFKTGIGLVENSPVLLLREKLFDKTQNSAFKSRDVDVMALTIKAFNNYCLGKRKKVLIWRENEKFPVPIKRNMDIRAIK